MNKKRSERISSAVAFLCGSNKLKSEQRMLEKTQEKLISGLKTLSLQERNELLDYARTLESNANKDVEDLQEELFSIFGLLREVNKEINDPEKLKQHEISYFRSKMDELEKRIHSLKGNCNRELKKLKDEEIMLTSEVENIEDKFEAWTNGEIRKTVKRAQSSSKILCSCSEDTLTPEVRTFRKFLDKTGGHYGGWSEDDHLLYVQLRQKHNSSATASLIHQKFPDISIEKALAHDTWFETYTQLKKEQERSIREWRENKKFSHFKTCCNYDGPKISASKVKSDPEMKEKLKLWKENQKMRKEAELEEKKRVEILKKKEEELKRQKQEQRRAFVNEYKIQKLNCEQALELAKQVEEEMEKQAVAARANSLLKTFRDEDMKYALRMRERLRQQKEKRSLQRSCSSSECSVQVSRDPMRVLKPTEGWRLKTAKREDGDVEVPPPFLHLRNIPHLGIPKWRRGLPFDT